MPTPIFRFGKSHSSCSALLTYSRRTSSFSCYSQVPFFFSKTPFSLYFPRLNHTAKIKMEESEDTATTPLVLVLSGKSAEENDVALSLINSNTLKLTKNSQVEVCPRHSEELSSDAFRINDYFNSLSTTCFGRLVIYSHKLLSTHNVISENNSELPVGTVCVADVQLKGRGRSSNAWESPKGCLLFSFSVQMEDGRMVPHLQYVISLAMTEGIKSVCLQKGIPQLGIRIKWPNDLYLGDLKVGGILSTSVYRSKKFYISAGVGLNVSNEKPTTCLNAVVKKLNSGSCELKREEIIAAFFNKFEDMYDVFSKRGFQPLEDLYYRTWLHSGQRIIVQERNDEQDQFVENVVTIQGLTSSGYLQGITDNGQMCELHPDGNSFDFFKGLIKRKVS